MLERVLKYIRCTHPSCLYVSNLLMLERVLTYIRCTPGCAKSWSSRLNLCVGPLVIVFISKPGIPKLALYEFFSLSSVYVCTRPSKNWSSLERSSICVSLGNYIHQQQLYFNWLTALIPTIFFDNSNGFSLESGSFSK